MPRELVAVAVAIAGAVAVAVAVWQSADAARWGTVASSCGCDRLRWAAGGCNVRGRACESVGVQTWFYEGMHKPILDKGWRRGGDVGWSDTSQRVLEAGTEAENEAEGRLGKCAGSA